MIIDDSDRVHLRHEAEHTAGLDSKFPGQGFDNPRVVSLPIELFRPPAFVRKTAADLYAEIEALMREVWELNEQCVGERLLEAEAYLVFADVPRPLIKRIWKWLEKYLLRRMQQVNPRDKGNPHATYVRLINECVQIIYSGRENRATIAGTLLPHCKGYVEPFVFERVYKSHFQATLASISEQRGEQYVRAHYADLIAATQVPPEMAFLRFLENAATPIDQAWQMQRSADTADDLRRDIKLMVDDIQQMRPLLIRNFRLEKSLLELSSSFCIAFDWAFGMASIGNILHGSQIDEFRRAVPQNKTMSPQVDIDQDGLLHDSQTPWITTADIGSSDTTATALHVNLFLLERIHEKLFSFYDQIDFEAIRRRLQHADKAELDDEELGVTCLDLAEPEPVGEPEEAAGPAKAKLRIVPLRLQRLLVVLEKDLGCEVAQGKGSEITVYRPGGKIYVLGRHKADYPVPVPIVKALLSRVGIQAQEWIAVCQKGGRVCRQPS